jgi:hypothetical protein
VVHGASSCIVWYHRAPSSHTPSARAPATRTTSLTHHSFTCRPPSATSSLKAPPRILLYDRDIMARVVALRHPWARSILVEAGNELLERARLFAADWAANCVSLSSYFLAARVVSATATFGHLTDELTVRCPHSRRLSPCSTPTGTNCPTCGGGLCSSCRSSSAGEGGRFILFLLGSSLAHCAWCSSSL